MTAADATFSEHVAHEDSSAARVGPSRRPGSAGVILAALGLFAFQLAISTMETTGEVLVLDRQAGRHAVPAPDDASGSCGSRPAS